MWTWFSTFCLCPIMHWTESYVRFSDHFVKSFNGVLKNGMEDLFDLYLPRGLAVCRESFIEGERWRSHLLSLIVRSHWKLDLLCTCPSSEKQGICHFCRPVSQDRQILVMKMEVSKAAKGMVLWTYHTNL